MTYPQQPQYGPPQPGYQPAQYAPQQAPTYTVPQFSEPGAGLGDGGSPLKIREIEGRICGFQPTKYVAETTGVNGQTEKAKIIGDILILDGPVPLEYGASNGYQDNPAGPPVYAVDSLPVLIKGVTFGNTEVVKKAKEVLDTAPGNTIPCRIVRGTKGQNPYFLAEINGDLDPGTTPAEGARLRGMLGAAYAAVGTGRWPDGSPYVAPVPREINGGPRQKPQAAPAQPVSAPSYPPQASYTAAQPAGVVQYPPQPAYQPAAVPAQPQFAPGSREAFLSGQDVPGGWPEPTWRGMTPDLRAQFLPAQ